MPKKTKREKVIAEYRRKLQTLGTHPTENISPEPKISNLPTFSLPPQSPLTIALPQKEFQEIQKDLITTIIKIAIFFILEFVLWRLV